MAVEWLIWGALFFGIPAAIGLLMGASWTALLEAFAILVASSCLLGFPTNKNWDQRATWAANNLDGLLLTRNSFDTFLMRMVGFR